MQPILDGVLAPLAELGGWDAGDPGERGRRPGHRLRRMAPTTLAMARRVGNGGRRGRALIPRGCWTPGAGGARAGGSGGARKLEVGDARACGASKSGRFDAAGNSRFGVMFFDDPVAAFANIGGSRKRRGGKLAFVAWRGPREKFRFFMTTAARAAAPFLPQGTRAGPDAPTAAFAGRARVRRILRRAAAASRS
ncbi:hypothetical protein ACVOMV_10185 [Mesorhizobium atlanticum]